jgi:hypothetical protein
MRGAMAAIERELCRNGLVYRYTISDDAHAVDGRPSKDSVRSPRANGCAAPGRHRCPRKQHRDERRPYEMVGTTPAVWSNVH